MLEEKYWGSTCSTSSVCYALHYGQGHEGLVSFCGTLDLPASLSRKSYDVIVDQLPTASKDVAVNSMKQAALAEMELTESRNNTNLSCPKLLRRCSEGKTQNKNESLNSVIWKLCPKRSGCGRKIAEIAVNEAVIAFNEGRVG
ncbi:hypothetical protein JTE90_026904 [Oedothorax gibbosus]|uniref:Vitellogenin n=1 Tax=Oedothorax gibbosus TaxID=931172 RepID=A0AAV6UD86_9ARAC|nr:hypothetical protein JTE90_026904 [Oedothorax gibbosus]